MLGRGIKPFTKRVEDCRNSLREQTPGGGREYVAWLEAEPKRRLAASIAESDLQARAEPQKFKKTNGE